MTLKEYECHHSIGSPMDGAQPSPKTNRDHLMKYNLGHYCLKTYETARERKRGGCRWVL